jgi:hypothetical protein
MVSLSGVCVGETVTTVDAATSAINIRKTSTVNIDGESHPGRETQETLRGTLTLAKVC